VRERERETEIERKKEREREREREREKERECVHVCIVRDGNDKPAVLYDRITYIYV